MISSFEAGSQLSTEWISSMGGTAGKESMQNLQCLETSSLMRNPAGFMIWVYIGWLVSAILVHWGPVKCFVKIPLSLCKWSSSGLSWPATCSHLHLKTRSRWREKQRRWRSSQRRVYRSNLVNSLVTQTGCVHIGLDGFWLASLAALQIWIVFRRKKCTLMSNNRRLQISEMFDRSVRCT